MKQEYNIPDMEVIVFEQEDLVRTSADSEIVDPGDIWWGDSL